MGFATFKNQDLKSFVPQIHRTAKIGTVEGYKKVIDEEKLLRSVLIWANGSLHA